MPLHPRTGFSLIEVIICMGLVGVMLMPLAAMMKASAHAWQDAEAEGGADARLRCSARWVGDTLQRGDGIVDLTPNRIDFQTAGNIWRMEIVRGQLRMHSGAESILIADEVTAIRFAAHRHPLNDTILAVDIQLTGHSLGGDAAPQVSTTVALDTLKQF